MGDSKRYGVIAYPKGETPAGARYLGRATTDTRARREVKRLHGRLVTDNLPNLDALVVVVSPDGVIGGEIVDHAGNRVDNPGKRGSSRKAPPAWAIKYGRAVWKSAPKDQPREDALIGILRASELEKKAASKALRTAYPSEPAGQADPGQKSAALRRRVSRLFDALADERVELRSWSIGAREAAIVATANRFDATKPIKRAELVATLSEFVDQSQQARIALDKTIVRKGLAGARQAVNEIRLKAPEDVDTRALEQRLAEVTDCPAPAPATTRTGISRPITVREKRPFGEAAIGASTLVFYPDARAGLAGMASLKTHYAIVEVSELIPSHDAFTFSESPKYPVEMQERDYARDSSEQQKVIRQAQKLQPELVIALGSDAVSGPPVVASDGIVLGGNSRTMALRRALEGDDTDRRDRYLNYLREQVSECSSFGLTPDALDGYRSPALVRLVDKDEKVDPVRISRDLNRALTQDLGPAAEAVSLGRMLPRELFEVLGDELADPQQRTITQILDRRSDDVVRILTSAGVITTQNQARFLRYAGGKPTRGLSAEGRGAIKNAIAGALLGDKEAAALTTGRQEAFYERVGPLILGTMGLEDDWDMVPAFQVAAQAVALFPSANRDEWRSNFRWGELAFDDASKATIEAKLPELFASPTAAIWASWIVEAAQTPKKGFDALRTLVNHAPRARGQVGLGFGGGPSFAERLSQMLSGWPEIKATPEEVLRVGVARWLAGLRSPAPAPPSSPKPAPAPPSSPKPAPAPPSSPKPKWRELEPGRMVDAADAEEGDVIEDDRTKACMIVAGERYGGDGQRFLTYCPTPDDVSQVERRGKHQFRFVGVAERKTKNDLFRAAYKAMLNKIHETHAAMPKELAEYVDLEVKRIAPAKTLKDIRHQLRHDLWILWDRLRNRKALRLEMAQEQADQKVVGKNKTPAPPHTKEPKASITATREEVKRAIGSRGFRDLGPKQLDDAVDGYNRRLEGKPAPAQHTALRWVRLGWDIAGDVGHPVPMVFESGDSGARIKITFSPATGARIEGTEKADAAHIKWLKKEAGAGWSFSSRGFWYRPQSRGQEYPNANLYHALAALKRRGLEAYLRIDLSGTKADATKAKAAHKAERAEVAKKRAEKLRKEGEAALARGRKELEHIPMGQPILRGHHSETKHRAALKRSESATRKGLDKLAQAERLEARSEGLEIDAEMAKQSQKWEARSWPGERLADRAYPLPSSPWPASTLPLTLGINDTIECGPYHMIVDKGAAGLEPCGYESPNRGEAINKGGYTGSGKRPHDIKYKGDLCRAIAVRIIVFKNRRRYEYPALVVMPRLYGEKWTRIVADKAIFPQPGKKQKTREIMLDEPIAPLRRWALSVDEQPEAYDVPNIGVTDTYAEAVGMARSKSTREHPEPVIVKVGPSDYIVQPYRPESRKKNPPNAFAFRNRVAVSIKFPKRQWSKTRALQWSLKHGAAPKHGAQSRNFWIVELESSESMKNDSFRTLKLPNGVQILFGTPKRRANPGALEIAGALINLAQVLG